MTPTCKMKPTVGRIVWYVPLEHERFIGDDGSDRWPAIVCHVWSDACVNLAVIDPNGALKPHTSVTLAAEDAEALPGQCEWMPYQKGQAAALRAQVPMTPPRDDGNVCGGFRLSSLANDVKEEVEKVVSEDLPGAAI